MTNSGFRVWENEMGKRMDNEMDTGCIHARSL